MPSGGDGGSLKALNKQVKAEWESQRASVTAYKKVAHASHGRHAEVTPYCSGNFPNPFWAAWPIMRDTCQGDPA